jgi:hypothetical protein
MSVHSDCNCSAIAAQHPSIHQNSHPTPMCPSSPPAITSPDRQRPTASVATQQELETASQRGPAPVKRRKKKGPAPKSLYADMKGHNVDIPGWVFGVEIPELFYRGTIVGKDASHSGCVVVRTEDGQRYFFPAPEVTGWMDDMQERISPQPGATMGAACDRYAAPRHVCMP